MREKRPFGEEKKEPRVKEKKGKEERRESFFFLSYFCHFFLAFEIGNIQMVQSCFCELMIHACNCYIYLFISFKQLICFDHIFFLLLESILYEIDAHGQVI